VTVVYLWLRFFHYLTERPNIMVIYFEFVIYLYSIDGNVLSLGYFVTLILELESNDYLMEISEYKLAHNQ
jgi:hypothetical protein